MTAINIVLLISSQCTWSVWAEKCLRISEGTDQHDKSLHLCVSLNRCPSVSLARLDMSHLTALVEFLTDSLQIEERLRETEYITFNYLYTHTHTHTPVCTHAHTPIILYRGAETHTHTHTASGKGWPRVTSSTSLGPFWPVLRCLSVSIKSHGSEELALGPGSKIPSILTEMSLVSGV